MTAWGFLAVIVACLAAAWAYLRKRVVLDVVDEQRAAMDKAREDAALASERRHRTAGEIAAQGAPDAQAAAVTDAAVIAEAQISGDTQAQAVAVAALIGVPPPVSNAATERPE